MGFICSSFFLKIQICNLSFCFKQKASSMFFFWCRKREKLLRIQIKKKTKNHLFFKQLYQAPPDTTQLLTTSNFIGRWYQAALLF